MANSNITGRLLNARRIPFMGCEALVGECYEDVHGRFHDGEVIRTSVIKSEDGSMICTANSIYEVESWSDVAP